MNINILFPNIIKQLQTVDTVMYPNEDDSRFEERKKKGQS